MDPLSVFEQPQFSIAALTAALNSYGYQPVQISATGIFDEDGVTTATIKVEEQDGSARGRRGLCPF